MDEFSALLSTDLGLGPQGKATPMAAPKGSGSSSRSVPLPSFTSSAFNRARSPRESTLSHDPADHDMRGFGERSSRTFGRGVGNLGGIFAGGPFSKSASAHGSSFDYDSMFGSFKDPVPTKITLASGPVFDRPLHDMENIFDGIPGLKASSTENFDDVFASLSSSSSSNHHTRTADDDLLGELSGKDHFSSNSGRKKTGNAEQVVLGFDDLIPGFGGGSSPRKREYANINHQKSSQPNKLAGASTGGFTGLESTSVSGYPSAGLFVDPPDNIGTSSGSAKSDASNGNFDDVKAFSRINKSASFLLSDESNTKTPNHANLAQPTAAKESTERASIKSSDDEPKKGPGETYRKPEQTCFSMPTTNSNFDQFKTNRKQHPQENEDVWLTVSEIPLFTQPTSTPPPSRSPFSRKERPFAPMNKSELANADAKSKGNDNVLLSHPKKNYTPSSINELEDFSMGKPRTCAGKQTGVISIEEDSETGSAAATSTAAMKDAVDRAEAKMKQARKLRERGRESRTTKNTEFIHLLKKDKTTLDFLNIETGENLKNIHLEKELREKEDKENERRRIERDREKALVQKALREVHERATAEAWERAAAEAQQKAERAAFQKANVEARKSTTRAAAEARRKVAFQKANVEAQERAGQAAVNKATAEACERAAAEARERAAREAREREAKERENSERKAREKAAAMAWESQRAAVQRAVADARQRAEWAAVEKANREAHKRAAAREKQHKNENDLDLVFGTSVRGTSEPRHRPVIPDLSFDARVPNKVGSTGGRQASSPLSSSGTRKASSANLLDDVTSVFGGSSSSGEFQEINGESEERQRARLERHQRALERAAKALAEKNQRDMQVQREQAERDRIAERLEVDIKRWASGKEGNLRALLSTLQYVLWPECGWQAVSLMDLITVALVKKVYRKATLHLHPDKVQQKGANLEQKIIAEKVFDLLKEAWNKFNSEELF